MSHEVRRAAGFFVAVVAVGLGLVLGFPKLFRFASGPELEIITALKRTERDGLDVPLPGLTARLVSSQHHYDRITVRLLGGAKEALAHATLDFRGQLGATEVSSLGVEEVTFQDREAGGWAPSEGPAPRLAAIVLALERRRQALEQGATPLLSALVGEATASPDPEVARVLTLTHRVYRARAWFIRAERDEVLVSEEYRLEGDLPDRPVDESGTRRLKLARKGREFFFSNGLM